MQEPNEQSDQTTPDAEHATAPDAAPTSPNDGNPTDTGANEPSAYKLEERPSLLDDAANEDVCPHCNKPLKDPSAVVCMNCGYDLLANKILKTQVGDVEVAEDVALEDFARAGRLGWKTPVIVAAAALLLAAILSGMNATGRPVGHALATLLFGPVYAGVGVAAAAITAKLLLQPFGRIELAGARMLLATAIVMASFHVGQAIDAPNAVQFLVGAGIGAGLYYLAVWWLFSLNSTIAFLLSLLHLSLWAFFLGLLQLNAWLATSPPVS